MNKSFPKKPKQIYRYYVTNECFPVLEAGVSFFGIMISGAQMEY